MSRRKKRGRALRRRYGHAHGSAGITVAVHGTLTLSPEYLGTPEALGALPPAVVQEIAAEVAPAIAEAVVEAVETGGEHDYYPVRPE